jgi:hypothetical protein
MKFSRKMILIPASGREEPENEKMSDLDLEMSAIVKNPKLSNKEKVEMYNEVLRRNLIFDSQLSLKTNNTPNEIVTHIEKPDESLISNVSPFTKYEYEQLQTPKFIPTENSDIENNLLFEPIDFSDTEEIGKLETLRGWNEPPDNDTVNELEKAMPSMTWDNIEPNLFTNFPKLRNKKQVHYHESPSSLKKELEEKARIKFKKKQKKSKRRSN